MNPTRAAPTKLEGAWEPSMEKPLLLVPFPSSNNSYKWLYKNHVQQCVDHVCRWLALSYRLLPAH